MLYIAGWSQGTLEIIGLFLIGFLLVVILGAMAVAGLLLFVLNMMLKKTNVPMPGWLNIVLFIMLSALVCYGLMLRFGLDTVFT